MLFGLKQEGHGAVLVYFLFLLAWSNDAGAYFTGTFCGKTKGFIKASPNKSLEGYAGAFIVTMVIANAFKLIAKDHFPADFIHTNIIGIALSITAPSGDLVESMLKRRAGVKDSSHFLPGLGGVLDIFDSILLSTPVYYTLIRLFL